MKQKSGMALTSLAKKTASLAILSCASLFAASHTQAATLTYDSSSKIIGAKNIDVNGTIYDVSFKSGSCASLFNGCNELSDLDFNTWQGASDASNALFDLMRGIEPANLALVSNFDSYYLSTPYRLSGDNYDYNMVISYQYGYDIISGGLYLMNDVRDIVFNSNSPEANQLYVDWTPATPVPAPLPILGAVAAIGWSRKLRRRIRESQALAA